MSIIKDNFLQHVSPDAVDNRLLILELCIELLNSLNEDAQREFTHLAEDIVAAAQSVSTLGRDFPAQDADSVASHINTLLIRMQFSDRFCQRLENTRQSLTGLHEVMTDQPGRLAASECLPLLDRMRNTFTTEQERAIFDQIFGSSKGFISNSGQKLPDENICLFDHEGSAP